MVVLLSSLPQTVLQFRDLAGQLLDNPSGVVGPLRQLFFDFFMDLEVLLQMTHLFKKLLVLEDQFFGLFGLKF